VGGSCGRVDDSLFSGLLTGGVLRLPFPLPLPTLPLSLSLPRPFSSVPLVALRGYVRHTQNSPWSTPGDGISKYRPFRIYPRVTRYACMRTHTRTYARRYVRSRRSRKPAPIALMTSWRSVCRISVPTSATKRVAPRGRALKHLAGTRERASRIIRATESRQAVSAILERARSPRDVDGSRFQK